MKTEKTILYTLQTERKNRECRNEGKSNNKNVLTSLIYIAAAYFMHCNKKSACLHDSHVNIFS